MKLIYFLLFIIIPLSIIAQQNHKQIPQEITVLKKMLENFPTKKEMKNSIKNMDYDALKRAAKLLFEAYEKDAILTNQYFMERDKKIDSLNKKINAKNVMPNETKWKLLKRFKENFNPDIYALIWVPYLLKVKINSIQKYVYDDHKSPAKLNRTDVEAIVLEVIKGSSKFNKGEVVNFYFMDYWRPTLDNFAEGEYCFIPLAPATEYENDYKLIALVTTLETEVFSAGLKNNSSFGRYPIVEEMLIDKNNFWGYGEKINWNEFKINLIRNLNIIKSW